MTDRKEEYEAFQRRICELEGELEAAKAKINLMENAENIRIEDLERDLADRDAQIAAVVDQITQAHTKLWGLPREWRSRGLDEIRASLADILRDYRAARQLPRAAWTAPWQ